MREITELMLPGDSLERPGEGRLAGERSEIVPQPLGLLDRLRQLASREDPEDLLLTAAGEQTGIRLGEQLAGMLWREAQNRGHRRRASELDRTDFEAAYDDLLNPRDRPFWVDIIADILLGVGGLISGGGSSILINDVNSSVGWLVTLVGLAMMGIGIALKYIPLQ